MSMIDELIRTVKGVIPDSTWDFVFSQFPERQMFFKLPAYPAVRVSKDYILVKLPKGTKPEDKDAI